MKNKKSIFKRLSSFSLIFFISLLLTNCIGSFAKIMFEELDTNQDGYASYQEYKALMSQNPEYMEDLEKESKEQGITKEEMMQKDFDLIDRNGDKRITKKEIKQGIRDDL